MISSSSDLAIKRTLLAIRRSHRISEKINIPTKQMTNSNNKTFKELVALNVTYQPLYIEYSEVEGAFELKSRLIHLFLPFMALQVKILTST